MSNPKVSIIVTSYNDAKLLPKCLDALLSQTLKEIEIIGVNDASSDDTLEVLKRYAKQDSRVKYIDNPKNIGLAASRNCGIDKATAPFLMFCDADDYYEPTTCQNMYQAITQSKADLAISEIRVIYHAHADMKMSDDNYYSLKYHGLQQINRNIIFNTDLSSTNKIFRKATLDKYHLKFPEGKRFEDAYFCVAYFCVSQTAFFLNQQLYNYVRHAGSIMSQTWSKDVADDHAIDHLHIVFMLYDFLEQNELIDKYNELFWQYFEAFENFALRNSKSKERIRQVKAEARDFVANHNTSFSQANINNQENIRRLNSGKFYFSTTRLKRFLIKLMPTYRLATENIQRLRNLNAKQQQLVEKLDQLRNQR